MAYFPLSITVYAFVATVCLIEAIRSLQAYLKTNNLYSKLLFQVAIGVSGTQYIYVFSNIFYADRPRVIGILYILSLFLIFFGLKQALQMALIEWQWTKTLRFVNIIIPAALVILVVLHLQNIPLPVTENGVIHWKIPYPFNMIVFFSGAVITMPPALFLFLAPADSKKAMIKKYLFSATFLLGGIFGWSIVFLDNAFLLLTSYLMMALGFTFMAIMILVDIFMME